MQSDHSQPTADELATINDLIEIQEAIWDRQERHESRTADALATIRSDLAALVDRLKK